MILASVLSFTKVDEDFHHLCNYSECIDALKEMLQTAESNDDKAEIYWRLSRASLMIGVEQSGKEAKRKHFNQGMSYAEEGFKLNPTSINCYMWHCANLGRACQTQSLMDQAASVPAMMSDLSKILDELKRTDYSEAWQALSEIYHNHPFKSDDSALNYARMAALNVPKDELRISTYIYLAELLYDRGTSASKRASDIVKNKPRYSKTQQSNIEKYAYHDSSDPALPWTDRKLGAISDKEEADAILKYAKERYLKSSRPTPIDQKDYAVLLNMIKNNIK